jgi:predicted Zn-dependent protease
VETQHESEVLEERRQRHFNRQLEQQSKMMQMMIIAMMGDHVMKIKRDNCDGDQQDGKE